MIFTGPNALVYVLRSGLVVAGKHIDQARLPFPDDMLHNMEVIDAPGFIELCQKFFAERGLKHKRVLVILDNSIVFKKRIKLDQTGQPGTLAGAFVEAMPFESGQRACISLANDNELQLLATNSDLYQTIVDALREIGVSKIIAVSPVAVYNLEGTNQRLSSVIDRLFKDKSSSKAANFLSVDTL
ncbi:MAG TPA: hypothetical protein VLH84_00770 [Patescibacteria group bacterium]|nr:hypothetical protein [Patescibacteria group bacterium]